MNKKENISFPLHLSLSLYLHFFLVSPFRTFSRNRFSEQKQRHFCKFEIIFVLYHAVPCRARKFGIRFFFPFYLNKLSYLKRPPEQQQCSRSGCGFFSSLVFSQTVKNYDRVYSRIHPFILMQAAHVFHFNENNMDNLQIMRSS